MSFFSVDLMQSKRKCAVIGCLGTGGTIAWALAQSGLCDELVLIDDDKRTADGQVADILGALPYSASPDVWVGDYADLEGCSLIIMAVGIPALYESAQANQIELNLPLVRAAAAGIAANNSEAVVLVAGEPVDIMTHIALHSLGFPPSRVIGLGTLPLSLRTGKLIAQYLGTDSRNVQAMVLGTDDDNAFYAKLFYVYAACPFQAISNQWGAMMISLCCNLFWTTQGTRKDAHAMPRGARIFLFHTLACLSRMRFCTTEGYCCHCACVRMDTVSSHRSA